MEIETATLESQPLTLDDMAPPWPVAFADVLAARERLAPYLEPTPLRGYPLLDAHIGGGTSLLLKHEHHQPTGAFLSRSASPSAPTPRSTPRCDRGGRRCVARAEGRVVAHSTNSPHVIAGAATASLEMREQSGGLDAIVVAIGGGSQSVGALVVARELASCGGF